MSCNCIKKILSQHQVNHKPTTPDSKALDSGYHEQNFSRFWILQTRIPQILESGYPSNIFGPVHAYLIKQWEISFSSNVRF